MGRRWRLSPCTEIPQRRRPPWLLGVHNSGSVSCPWDKAKHVSATCPALSSPHPRPQDTKLGCTWEEGWGDGEAAHCLGLTVPVYPRPVCGPARQMDKQPTMSGRQGPPQRLLAERRSCRARGLTRVRGAHRHWSYRDWCSGCVGGCLTEWLEHGGLSTQPWAMGWEEGQREKTEGGVLRRETRGGWREGRHSLPS